MSNITFSPQQARSAAKSISSKGNQAKDIVNSVS
ncbi:UNVERIFIED_CONTAM: hypothetical protein Cloal_2530 [Acetivibrio alkalicellulosi]